MKKLLMIAVLACGGMLASTANAWGWMPWDWFDDDDDYWGGPWGGPGWGYPGYGYGYPGYGYGYPGYGYGHWLRLWRTWLWIRCTWLRLWRTWLWIWCLSLCNSTCSSTYRASNNNQINVR